MLKFYDASVKYYDFERDEDIVQKILILHEDSENDFDRVIKRLRENAIFAPHNKRGFMWKEYYAFKRLFADMNYSYAITAHKSQGSTYENTRVDVNDICFNQNIEERNRILYTAITRAKHKLLIIN
jgi:ATP-dependent exoDNAse (exonuclease V) alpha subunit